MTASSERLIFSPFTRVEGDLRLEVTMDNGRVASARASGTLFRGFEEMVMGRDPLDAIVFLCRICGQCGASHSAAAAAALADAFGGRAAPNGILARNVMQAVETILGHLAHFYFSFAGDLCALPGQEHLAARFAALKGTSFRKALRARRILLAVMGLFAGKWPNTLAIQPGGTTRVMSRAELLRARGVVAEFADFIEERLLGCRTDEWLGNRSLGDVHSWLDDKAHASSDLGAFISAALEGGLDRVGGGPGKFMSSGGFADPDGATWLGSGFYDGSKVQPLDCEAITEDVTFSWYESDRHRSAPLEGVVAASPDKQSAYSWSKAPRYGNEAVEVGPLARAVVGGDPLALDIVSREGPSVFARQLLRLHEIVRLVEETPRWIERIDPEEPFCVSSKRPEDGVGFALVEAPRGTLGHWVRLEHSRIRNYQVITPTGWNLSPRDEAGVPGVLEQALVGAPAAGGSKAAHVVLVVGSYDPCLYCSVH